VASGTDRGKCRKPFVDVAATVVTLVRNPISDRLSITKASLSIDSLKLVSNSNKGGCMSSQCGFHFLPPH